MIRLPPYRYIKDRSVSDYTYSSHADGYDDCLTDVICALDAAGYVFEEPHKITKDELQKLGLTDSDG